MVANSRILIVEDNPADVFLIREAIKAANIEAPIDVVKDGEEATVLFDHVEHDASAPSPGLVILDINLPKKNGIEVLQHLRRSERCREARVIVVSTSNSPKDRNDVIQHGADAYFSKPSRYDDFLKLGDLILEWLRKAKK